METITHLLSSQYLFNKALGPFTSELATVFLVVVLVGMIAGSIVSRMLAKQDIFGKKIAQKIRAFVWTMGPIAFILFLFRQLYVLYLGAPVFLLIWLIVGILWAGYIAHYWMKVVPVRREQVKKDSSKRDYLPR